MNIKQEFDKFVFKYNGKFVEVVDPTNKNQCMDLSRAWLDVLGHGEANNHFFAHQVYTAVTVKTKQYFDLISNTPEAIPQTGDIVVWSKSYNGTAGHIAICARGIDTRTFDAFSQNDPTGSPSTIRNYTYTNVLGWLRFKNQTVPAPAPATTIEQAIRELVKDQSKQKYYLDDPKRIVEDLVKQNELEQTLRADIRTTQKNWNLSSRELEGIIERLRDTITTLELSEVNAKNEVVKLQAVISIHGSELLGARKDCEKALDSLITKYEAELKELLDEDCEEVKKENKELTRQLHTYLTHPIYKFASFVYDRFKATDNKR